MMLTLTHSKMKIYIYFFVLIGYHFVHAYIVESVTTRPGRRVELKCDITDSNKYLIWFKKDSETKQEHRLNIRPRKLESSITKHEAILTLIKPTDSDKGIYILRKTGAKQRDICKINLDVLQPLTVRCKPSKHMPVKEHTDVTLTYRANKGNLTLNVTWYRIDSQGQKTYLSNTPELTIPSISRYATGKYECSVQRNKESDSCEIKVDVEFKPEVELYETEIKLREIKNAILMCRVTANPMSRVVWTKGNSTDFLYPNILYHIEEDDELLETHYTKYLILTLKAVSLKENMFGDYTCQILGYEGDDYKRKVSVSLDKR